MLTEIDDYIILLIRMGAIALHFLEFAGISIGTAVITFMIIEEFIEIYKDRRSKKQLKQLVHIDSQPSL